MKFPSTRTRLLALAMLASAGTAPAQTAAPTAAAASTPAARYAAESKTLSARYQSDLQICNSEAEAAGRMQCKRDAKTQYDKDLAAARAQLAAANSAPATSATAKSAPAVCTDCGTVASVTREQREGQASAVGTIAGGVVGGLLGNQVGRGTGKDLATIAGAAGGAYAGRDVGKRVNTRTVWVVKVNFCDGSSHSYEYAQDPGYKAGDAVKKAGSSIARP